MQNVYTHIYISKYRAAVKMVSVGTGSAGAGGDGMAVGAEVWPRQCSGEIRNPEY